MSIVRKIKRAVRGEVAVTTVAKEAIRRGGVAISRNRERANLEQLDKAAPRLAAHFANAGAADLLDHFRSRSTPSFSGFSDSNIGDVQRRKFPEETKTLLSNASNIVNEHRWPLLGAGEIHFGPDVNWHRDLLSGFEWPRDYHSSINLIRGDGSDVRVVWELNRLPHLLTLARAFAVTRDQQFSKEFFSQVASWREHNPYGYGVNWSCAMEVALRAMNLLAAFEVFRKSDELNEENLIELLALFDRHGTFIRQNLEFSYVVTSNHYLSDVVGLVWLGTLMPELAAADEWRDFGVREMLREMDKQVLRDGADFEASTGYHRFVTELFLYTFVLCRTNNVSIQERYWQKLRDMVGFLHAYVRPDGFAPLIGDSDSGQVLPVVHRRGDDHAYVAAVGAAIFNDSQLLLDNHSASEEVLWLGGAGGLASFQQLINREFAGTNQSRAYTEAGIYIMRREDFYLCFNASGVGIDGRGSHGHNDALSIEVSAHGAAFIVDAGTYVYTGDLQERHLFRSTSYHSTVEIDAVEQSATEPTSPFVIGNESRPQILRWESDLDRDHVSGEHHGYERLAEPVTHSRSVTFHKHARWWLLEDAFRGRGAHDFIVRFHFNAGLVINIIDDKVVHAHDESTGAGLLIVAINFSGSASLEPQFTSRDYLQKEKSLTARWQQRAEAPCCFRWAVVPVAPREDIGQRLSLVTANV